MQTETLPLALANPYKIGDGATLCSFSDKYACTVIAVTAKTVTVQRDEAKLLNGMNSGQPDALVCHPGGFCGHVDGKQRYKYTRNENGYTVVCRMKKKPAKLWKPDNNGVYGDVYEAAFTGNGQTLIPGRHEHYDFNF